MRIRRITVATAVLAALTTPLIVGAGTASAASGFAIKDEGFGATRVLAERNARVQIQADYGPCNSISIYDEGQFANNTWWADVSGQCQSFT